MSFNSFIISLAWPDALTRSANGPYDQLLKVFNIYKGGFYKTGHAALLLVNGTTGKVEYFDFGRYITPFKQGRIRSSLTDPEIGLPPTAIIKNESIINLDKLILWVGNNKETHGQGQLFCGAQSMISYNLAKDYINSIQNHQSSPYGPFQIGGTNCSRFVAQTISKSIKKGGKKFLFPIYGTPSPLGNVLNSNQKPKLSFQNNQLETLELSGRIKQLKFIGGKLIFKKGEQVKSIQENEIGTIIPPSNSIQEGTWLGGTGAGAWYLISEIKTNQIKVRRTQANGAIDFEYWFNTEGSSFRPNLAYQFGYISHALKVTLIQEGKTFSFSREL